MNSWIISGIILAVGFLFCLILFLRSKRQQNLVKKVDVANGKKAPLKYKEARDKLTFREEKEEESTGSGELGNIIGGFVAVLLGVTLLPAISQQVNSITNMQNVYTNASDALSTSAKVLINVVPMFFAVGIVAIGIAVTVSSLRKGGVM